MHLEALAICYERYMPHEDYGKDKGVSREAFKELATARWSERKKKAQKHAGLARGVTWARAVSDVGARHSGEDKRAWREEIKKAISTVGKFVKHAYNKLSQHDKMRFVVAFQEQEANIAGVAKNPHFIPEFTVADVDLPPAADSDLSVQGPRGGQVLPKPLFWAHERALDWTSKLMGGLDNYYLCRNVERRTFMPATCWVK